MGLFSSFLLFPAVFSTLFLFGNEEQLWVDRVNFSCYLGEVENKAAQISGWKFISDVENAYVKDSGYCGKSLMLKHSSPQNIQFSSSYPKAFLPIWHQKILQFSVPQLKNILVLKNVKINQQTLFENQKSYFHIYHGDNDQENNLDKLFIKHMHVMIESSGFHRPLARYELLTKLDYEF